MPIVNKGASILKIKDENIKRLDIEKSDILKKKMADDLMENDNPAYTQKYVEKLSSMGYDKKAVSEYADKINKSKEDLRQAEKDLDAVEFTLNPIKTFEFDETLGQNGKLDASGKPIEFTGIPQKSTEVEAKTSAYMPKSIKESVDKFAAETESTAAKSAAETKSTATQQYKNEKTRASFKAANALLTLGNPDAAINMFNQSLGNLTEETERTEYQEVVQGGSRDIQTTYDPSLNPAYSFTGLGTAYLNKKDYVKAAEYYQQALDYYKYKSPEAEVGVSTGSAKKVMPVDGDNNALSTALDGLALAKFKMGDKAGSQQAMMESNKIKSENTKQYALANQISVEAADEVQKQKRSEEVGGIHDMLETFISGYDPENKLGTIGFLNFPMKWVSGIQQGSETLGEGIKMMKEDVSKQFEEAKKTGDYSLGQFGKAAISGGLTTVEGLVGTAFASMPAITAFNAGISATNDLARLLPKEGETAVNELLEMPFTMGTLFANSLGINPDEKSDAAKLLRILDTAISFPVMHGAHVGFKKLSNAPLFTGVKDIADLKDIVNRIVKKGDPAEIKQIKTYTEYLKSLKLDDIKKAAEKNGDKEIAKTIESVQKKTPTDALHVKLAELKSDVRDENGNPNPEFEKLPASAQKEVLSNITALEKEISDKEISDVNNMSRASKLEADIQDLDSQIAETESKLPNFSAATQESVKRTINELKDKRNELKTEQDAIQKQSTGGLLQPETGRAGETGGKRGTLEQGVEGAEAATEGKTFNAGAKKTVAGVELVEPSYKEHNDLVAERNTPEWTQKEVAKLEESDAIDIEEIERKAKADEDFAILTGTNPEGKAHTDIENAKLQEKAVKWLEDKGYKPKKVVGKYGQGEASLFVDKMTLEDAAAFRKEFQQESVAHSKAMVYDGKYIDRVKSKDRFDIGEFKEDTDSATAVRQTDGTTKGFKLDYDWDNYKPIKEIIAEKAEMKAEKAKPEPLTKSEKAKYDILKSKEKRGKATDADKASIAKYDKKIDQAGIVERTKSAVSNVIKALKKIVPTLEVKTYETTKEFETAAREQAFTEEYYKLKEKQEIEELTLDEIQKIKEIEDKANSSIKAGGLFDGETIHLNLEKIKTNSLFHEAVHPILNAINAVNPKAISRIFEQVKTVEKKLGIEGKYTEEFASNYEQSRKEMEAITEFIADVADGNIEITKSNFDFIKKAFVDMMRYFGVDLSSSIKTVGELKTLAENIAYSFETGTELSISKKGKSGFLDTSGKPLSIADMQYSIHNDFSDAVTKMTFEYLANAEKFKKLQEAGFITENKTFDEYNNRRVFFHSPDGAFTGMIFKDGQLMVEGKGGLYYPIRFHEDGYFWASTENAANGMVAQLNAQAKLNGGKIFMALTSAPADKLLSSTTVSNGVMDLFLSKILDKKTNISKSIVRKAIFDAAHADSAVMKNIKVYLKEDLTDIKKNKKLKIKNEELKQKHGKVYRDDKGEYVYKKELVGLKLSSLDLKGDLDEIVSTIRKKLGADKSSFKDRKHFSETLITKIAAKIKGTPAEQSLGEFLHIGISNLDMKNVTKKGYNLSKANISAAISHMFHEPLIRPEAEAPLKKGEKAKEANGRVYAVLELECKPEKIRLEGKTKKEIKALTKMYGDPIKDSSGSYVEAYVKTIDSNKHESYPKAIVPTDGKSKTKVHIMQDRELWHENVLDPKTGKRPKANRLKSIFPTSGVTNTSLLVSAREKVEGEVSGKAEAEPTSKAGTDPVAKAGKRKEMTEDDKGNYLFFHYSNAKFNKLNPEKVGKHLATSRGETPAKKMSMLYTRPDRLEPGVPSENGYVVRVPKNKVYHFNTDPLNLLPEAENLFRKENGKDKSFDLNNQVAYVAKVAAQKGFPVTTSDWNIKGTKALRAQTTEVLPVEKYSNIKPGTTNQVQFNPEFENVKPNAKRRDIQYSLEGESLETALDRALEVAKNSSISKGLAEFKESEYFKKQDKEIQAELEDYFKEEAGPVEKGALEDKFDALDDIANKLKEPLTKSEINELTSKRKAIFDENPEVKEINDNFSKITRQLEENGELKKSRKDCP
jgi:hypothetical protein